MNGVSSEEFVGEYSLKCYKIHLVENEYCENVRGLLLVVMCSISGFSTRNLYFCMNLLIGPVNVGLIELKIFASCVKLCSDLSLAMEKIGLKFPKVYESFYVYAKYQLGNTMRKI